MHFDDKLLRAVPEPINYTEEEVYEFMDRARGLIHSQMAKGLNPDTMILSREDYKKLIQYLSTQSGGVVVPTSYMNMKLIVVNDSPVILTHSDPQQALSHTYNQ